MKAKNNYTGEIVEIDEYSPVTYRTSDGTLAKSLIKNFTFLDAEKDYYTKLEHTYAGMAMQGMLNNNLLSSVLFKIGKTHEDYINEVVNVADEYAKALISRMKNV